jgi:hypothetical protein
MIGADGNQEPEIGPLCPEELRAVAYYRKFITAPTAIGRRPAPP